MKKQNEQTTLRLPRELKKRMVSDAKGRGISLGTWIRQAAESKLAQTVAQ
jgi:predicted HicB family RNase H-like nuclease